MYETVKNYIYTYANYILNFIVLCFLLILFLLCRGGNDNSKQAEIQSSINYANGAGQSISNASEQTANAQLNIQRASGTIDRVSKQISDSKETAKSSSDELSELTKLAEECRERNQRIKALLDEAGSTDKK